jgi:hypothetical protein
MRYLPDKWPIMPVATQHGILIMARPNWSYQNGKAIFVKNIHGPTNPVWPTDRRKTKPTG